MRRTEAREAVRMARFLNLLHRWESAELNQEEAAELLGVSERTFRRWTRRYEEDGEAGLLDRRLGKASGRRVPADRAEEVERLYRERYQGFTVKHFHEHLVKDHGFGWGYTWSEAAPAMGGRRAEGAAQGGASAQARAAAAAGHDAASEPAPRRRGRLAACLARGPAAARSHCHARRRDGRDLFGVSRRGGRHGLDLPGAERGLLGARPADEPLHRSRRALFPHPQGRRDRPRLIRPRSGGRSSQLRGRAYRGLFAAGARPFGAGVPDAAGPAAEGAQARRHNRHRGGQRLHPRDLSAGPQRPLRRRSGRRGLGLHAHSGRRSRRDPVRAGGAAGRPRQLRLLPDAETADPRKPDAARISSRRGSRSTSIPTARTPSFTGPAASAATTRKEAQDDDEKRAA